MYCSNCGQEIQPTDAFCRNCGAVNNMAETVKTDSEPQETGEPTPENAYTRTDYNPASHAGTTRSGNQPGVTGSIVFSVINIVAFGFGGSMILGIIALIITMNANNQLTGEALAAKLHTARTLNIIGIALVLIQIVVIVSIIVFAILGSVMWQVWQ